MQTRRLAIALVFFVALLGILSGARAKQTNYSEECITSVTNVTVHANSSASLTLPENRNVEPGDTIAVYTPRGNCAGYGVWRESKGVTLAAAGQDLSDAGFTAGEEFGFEVYDVSEGLAVQVTPTETSYVPCDSTGIPFCSSGTYADDAFVQLAGFSSSDGTQRTIRTANGWNLLSVPLKSDDQSFGSIFPSCTSGYFYSPISGYQGVDASTSVSPGRGMFAKCSSDTTSVQGTAVSTDVTVEAGWNAIGVMEDTIAVENISSSPSGILQSNIYRMTTNGGYAAASELRPGEGYWVRSTEAGTLDVSISKSASRALATSGKESRPTGFTSNSTHFEETNDGVRLTITDASGRQANLFVADAAEEQERPKYALPPRPPEEVFDIRFSNGSAMTSRTKANTKDGSASSRSAIQVQGASFPLRIRLRSSESGQTVRIAPNEENVLLSSTDPTGYIRKPKTQFAIETASKPAGFKLGKTSPNPIRNRATVQFAVPKEVRVSVVLYDILGRRVAQLVDRTHDAGVHRTTLDGSDLASGTYFARMEAGSFRQTRRLTVVK